VQHLDCDAYVKRSDFRSAPEWTWRKVQAAADLKALVRGAELIEAMVHAGGPAELVAERMTAFLENPSQTLESDNAPSMGGWLTAVLERASTPTPLMQTAMAAAFASTLLEWWSPDDVVALWAKHHAQITAYPSRERAAFINALRELLYVADVEVEPPLDLAHCLSATLAEVCAHLRAIAQGATESELRAISEADYGHKAEEHLAALISVVRNRGGVIDMESDGAWFPLEVVQLRSHGPDEVAHLVATAVVLLTAVHNDDNCSDAEFRWFRQHDHYRTLPSRERDAIIAAMRYCYEKDVNFAQTESFKSLAKLLPTQPLDMPIV
jgi:hypothetical protein